MNRLGQPRKMVATTAGAYTTPAALLSAGCGSEPPPAAGVPEGHPGPGQVCAVDRAPHDTPTDTGPDDAHQQARRWAHPDPADNPPPAGRHPRWALWTAHQVVVDVAVQPWAGDGLPADTDQRAHRTVGVSATPVGDGDLTRPTTRHTVYCTLGGGRWPVTGYQVDGGR